MTSNVSIHRLLDEAFAGAPAGEAAQDLKEELRTNLLARVTELEGEGVDADRAARQAFDELGDVSTLLADDADDPAPDWVRHKVRYPAGFVVRTTVASLLAAAALAVGVLVAAGVVEGGLGLADGLVALCAVLLGLVTADSLLRETTGHFAMPGGRAAGYGVGTGLLLAGVGAVALCRAGGPVWAWLVVGGVLVLAGVGVLAGLGATQTNRTKPWVREHAAQYQARYGAAADGFASDPNAAARFGIYTVVLWVVATVVAVLLGVLVGWWWSALPWVAAFVVMLLLLTRMLFAPGRTDPHR